MRKCISVLTYGLVWLWKGLLCCLTRWTLCILLLWRKFGRGQHRYTLLRLKFTWTLDNRCPQLCEVRVNSYPATKQYWRSTRYLVCRGQRVMFVYESALNQCLICWCLFDRATAVRYWPVGRDEHVVSVLVILPAPALQPQDVWWVSAAGCWGRRVGLQVGMCLRLNYVVIPLVVGLCPEIIICLQLHFYMYLHVSWLPTWLPGNYVA